MNEIINWNQASSQMQSDLLSRPAIAENESLAQNVANIIEQVKREGDTSLLELTAKFDGVKLSKLKISDYEIKEAKVSLSKTRLAALETAYQQIAVFHEAQKPAPVDLDTRAGVRCQLLSESLESVGLYIPAGSAPLPSTVLMLGVPAKIAGCSRVVLACPPNSEGKLAPEVLAAASLCGIDEIYLIGGAQAIAALALGTETIKPVCKAFGPGNRFVTEAKKQLSQLVPGFTIDMPAGPSELLVIADDSANADFVAADLLSQAEHGPDSQVILLSDSTQLLSQTQVALEKQLEQLSRADIARKALEKSSLILTDSLATACAISNQYGPEHLSVQTRQPRDLLPMLRSAGSVFLGDYSPESAGDYASGTNHVLPTYGYTKVLSSLTLADFMRRFTVQELTKDGLASLADTIIELTDAEGLDAHQRAVTIRLEQEK